MNTKKRAGSSLLTISFFVSGGCSAGTDLVRSGAVKAETLNGSSLTLGKPQVRQQGDSLLVTGDIRRADFAPMRSGGHVHVVLVNAAGEETRAATAPYAVPPGRKAPHTPGPRSARYHVELPNTALEGGTVRVAVCSKLHPATGAKE